MSLLDELRATGEKLAEAELPSPAETPRILAALAVHVEQAVPDVGTVDPGAIPGKEEPPPAEEGAPPAAPPPTAPPIATDDEDAEATELAKLREENAQLQAQVNAAAASAPAVTSEAAPPA